MNERFNKLKVLLMELFQLDQPDLDFGLYRVMHAKSGEIKKFLEDDLLPQVKSAFAKYQPADKAAIESELEQAIANLRALGVADPEESSKVKELRERLASEAVDIGSLEADAFDHLYSFFRRYYSEGDFLSKRVYKPGVYAIPYEGEEVKLHWANADQYYIKTSEYLRDYAFRLRPDNEANPMRVHFRLVDAAEGEHGNVKEHAGKERRFRLVAESPVTLESGELFIRFAYQPDAAKQKDLNAAAEEVILASTEGTLGDWIRTLGAKYQLADGTQSNSSCLRVYLDRYTARNTFDYFIHKDLGAFLRRELDFYIKNEVLHLDDIEGESVPRVEQYLSKIKVIRQIASKIIDFLTQLEDFQKKLWLKQKFVVETSYHIQLGAIAEDFYPDIARNPGQLDEWNGWCSLNELRGSPTSAQFSVPLSTDFLRAFPTLMVNTRHFDQAFCDRLLAAFSPLHSAVDATLIHSENFQALSLLRRRDRNEFKCIYIDPPYNTDAGPIDYKNGYRNSSWMTMIQSRLWAARSLLAEDGVLCVTIDDYQVHQLAALLDEYFGKDRFLGTAVIRNNPSGRPSVTGLSVCHEYALFYSVGDAALERLPRTAEQLERFTREEGGYVNWQPFLKGGGAVTYRAARPKQYYPIYVDPVSRRLRIPTLSWDKSSQSWVASDSPAQEEVAVWPVDDRGRERIWSLSHNTASNTLNDLEVRVAEDGAPSIFRRHRPTEGVVPRSWWDKSTYGAREYGTATLARLFGDTAFSFAKSPYAVEDCLRVAGLASGDDRSVLDYFAGSGTTGEAVIRLNHLDGGQRKFTLVEQGDHFDTVLVPRLVKLVFSSEWKNGKPERAATADEAEHSPKVMKVVRLESYEDTLNNLEVHRTQRQQVTLGFASTQGAHGLREQYLLRYMLDVETRGSQSLLNVAAFVDPTSYKLKIRRPGSDETREANVDLLETFNWLIGLTVQQIAAPHTTHALFKRDDDPDLPHGAPRRLLLDGDLTEDVDGKWWFRTVTGTTPDGRKTLVIWRKRPGGDSAEGVEEDNLVLNEWFKQQGYGRKDRDFDLIYVNGGNNLENLKAPVDKWSARIIEDDFHRLMFETDAN